MDRANTPATAQPGAPAKVIHYPVSEIFPAIQGEGMLIGHPTVFVRLGGCDYRCDWCDSLYAVLPEYRKEWTKLTAEAIVAGVRAVPTCARHVTLSGGNPAIHPCDGLVKALHGAGYRVAVETQGTVTPAWLQDVDDLTLSPKPPSAGNVTASDPGSPLACLINSYPASAGGRAICLKFVVFDDEDFAYARRVHRQFRTVPCYLQVGTAVGIDTATDLLRKLSALQDSAAHDPAMADVHCLPQLHVLLHGHRRGI